jgi:hypothetical protein
MRVAIVSRCGGLSRGESAESEVVTLRFTGACLFVSLAKTTGPTATKPPPEKMLQDGVCIGSLKGGRYILKAG